MNLSSLRHLLRSLRNFLLTPYPFSAIPTQNWIAPSELNLNVLSQPCFNSHDGQRCSIALRKWASQIDLIARSVETIQANSAPSQSVQVDARSSQDLELRRRQIRLHSSALHLLALHAAKILPLRSAPETVSPSESLPFEIEKLNLQQPALGGHTLLTFFTSSSLNELVDILILLGANPEAPNAAGDTPLSISDKKLSVLHSGAGLAARHAQDAEAMNSSLLQASLILVSSQPTESIVPQKSRTSQRL